MATRVCGLIYFRFFSMSLSWSSSSTFLWALRSIPLCFGRSCTSLNGVQRSTWALRLHDSHLSISEVLITLTWVVECICWLVHVLHEDTGWMMGLCRWVLGVSATVEMQSNLMDERHTYSVPLLL